MVEIEWPIDKDIAAHLPEPVVLIFAGAADVFIKGVLIKEVQTQGRVPAQIGVSQQQLFLAAFRADAAVSA